MTKKFEVKNYRVDEKVLVNEKTKEEQVFDTKSALFRYLYDQKLNVSQISKLTNNHYSFVYSIIDEYSEGKIRSEKRNSISKSNIFRQEYLSGKTIGEIAKSTNSNYSYVFSVIKKYRESDKYEADLKKLTK